MDNEIMALMQLLSKKAYVTLKDIEHSANITRRQAMYRIDKVNDLLRLKQAEPISNRSNKRVAGNSESQTDHRVAAIGNESQQAILHEQERASYLYVYHAVYESRICILKRFYRLLRCQPQYRFDGS